MRLALGLVLAGAISAQPPAIGQNGVVNAASRIPPTLAGGAIAPGSAFSIIGVRFGSSGATTAVTVSPGGSVRVLSVSPEEIQALMPGQTPSGEAMLTVSVAGQSSRAFPIRVAPSNPGIFARNGKGWGPGRIENLSASNSRSPNSSRNPAPARSRIVFAVTGLGAGSLIDVMIGGKHARGTASPSKNPGEEEITVRIPGDAPEGCNVPVSLAISSVRASNVVTAAIGSGACVSRPIPEVTGAKVGIVVISRSVFRERGKTSDAIYDEAIASFAAFPAGFQVPLTLLPPAGTCTSYASTLQSTTILPDSMPAAIIAGTSGRGLDAGRSLTLRRGDATRSISQTPGARGFYRARLGDTLGRPGSRALAPFLDPAAYSLAATGGKEVGAFTLTLPGPQPFSWTNADQIESVDRGKPSTLRWTGAGEGKFIVALASNVDQISTAASTAVCVARSEAGQLQIPAAMLANLPASSDAPGLPYDQLFLGLMPGQAAAFEASGLDSGAAVSLFAVGRQVTYR